MMLHPAVLLTISLAAAIVSPTLCGGVAAFAPGGSSSATTTTARPRGDGRHGVIVDHRRHDVVDNPRRLRPRTSTAAAAAGAGEVPDEDEDDPTRVVNPYADPNYPDLEFVNYDDPEYSADRSEYSDGSDDVIIDNVDATLAEIEAMREDRRKRNDEYQFETYHASVLRGGERSLGEWTVFQTDTFMGRGARLLRDPKAQGVPRLVRRDGILKVVSRGSKVIVDPEASWRVDGERIVHEERLATHDDFPALMMMIDDDDYDYDDDSDNDGSSRKSEDAAHVEGSRCWPDELSSLDFRGPGGNMCVGKAYTTCDATPLSSSSSTTTREHEERQRHEGPFREMRAELGVQENGMRFRVKLDYALLEEEEDDDDASVVPPPLHLRTLTVCRETLDGYWPRPSDNESSSSGGGAGGARDGGEGRSGGGVRRTDHQEEITRALFGPPGAPGGLYDPPPLGSEERAISNYMLLDFEGGATLLLPHRLDQHGEEEGEEDGGGRGEDASSPSSSQLGWVTSLDWTPGRIRYQVDRKVLGGTKLKGLRTLELSEVQGEDADRWRPKDGGSNMRQ
ncbi:hypothetical protein ACHAW5_004590 [Stephanodiscus triporus]|uniref:Uncharacterized protein n=1 Tax=Stephanodiscus triporus TaxID=2934178 RepID=A0ABD3QBC9_9STRA